MYIHTIVRSLEQCLGPKRREPDCRHFRRVGDISLRALEEHGNLDCCQILEWSGRWRNIHDLHVSYEFLDFDPAAHQLRLKDYYERYV